MAGVLVTFGLWIVTLLSLALGIVYIYVKLLYQYFEKRGIPYDKPTFPFGSYTATVKGTRSLSVTIADIHAKNKRNKLVGLFSFWQKQILVRDPEIIKHILVKDSHVFQDRGMYYNKEKDPLSAHLFTLDGDDWKFVRSKVTPTFTSGKIKGMHSSIVNCAKLMDDFVEKSNSSDEALELQSLFIKYALEVISTTAFGFTSESLTNEHSKFVQMARRVVETTAVRFVSVLLFINGQVGKLLNTTVVPKDASAFFLGVFKDAMRLRRDNKIIRNDYLQLLMDLQNVKSQESSVGLTEEELAAQAFVFVVAGSETTSSTMSFCLYELSRNPEIQARVHQELDALPDLSHESVLSCQYLDMVVCETLRKYPPLGFLNRECARDYKVPNTDVVIDKGTVVLVSLQGLQNDPELFPDPEVFNPERFSKENKNNIKAYSYMPFGDGPRYCLGKRFAMMVVKTGLATILQHYQVRPPQHSNTKPLKMEPRSFINFVAGGIWLELKDRT